MSECMTVVVSDLFWSGLLGVAIGMHIGFQRGLRASRHINRNLVEMNVELMKRVAETREIMNRMAGK